MTKQLTDILSDIKDQTEGDAQVAIDPNQLMDDAIEVARQAVQFGEAPIGAVLYDLHGRRIAQGWNQRRATGDITRHAEMVAFQAAAQPGNPTHPGLILASTLEPCVMCWGASLELQVSKIIFGLEAPPNGGSTRINDANRQCEVIANVHRDRCRKLFVDWLDDHPDHAGADFVGALLQST